MTGRRCRALGAVALLMGLAVGVGGCVAIPTAGPVVQVSVSPGASVDNPVDIAALPPAPGATPSAILEGFMAAESSSSPTRFDVARQYLTTDAAATWDPNQGAQIYQSQDHPPITTTTSATVQAPLIGQLDAAGHFTSVYQADFSHDFGMVQVDGQWRISDPGTGILLPQYLYDRYYQAVPVYFLSLDGKRVVAEQVHVNQVDITPTSVVQSLLRGPSSWLSSAVLTAIPAETRLSAPSVTVGNDGVAQVSLTEQIDSLDDAQRLQMAAQLLWSLSSFDNIWGVHITLKGAPFVIPGQDADGVLSRSIVSTYLPSDQSGRDVFVVQDGVLGQLSGTLGQVAPVSGPMGQSGGAAEISTLAVSSDESVMAAVDPAGSRLSVGTPSSTLAAPTGVSGVGFVRPQVDADDDVWDFSQDPSGPVLTMCVGQTCSQVSVPDLAGWHVVAFRISPDRTKIAVVVSLDGQVQLGLLRLRTGEQIVADGWLPLWVTSTRGALTGYRDVAWASDTQLMVLAASSADGYVSTYLMDADGSQVESYGPSVDTDPVALAVLPLNNAGPAALMMTSGGHVYRFEDPTRWTAIGGDKITAVAYAG